MLAKPVSKEIQEVIQTSDPNVKTFFFEAPEIAKEVKPGNFLMVWIPRVDEIPLSVSHVKDDQIGITVKKVGEATSALYSKQEGDILGLRGPYGNSFQVNPGSLIIAGGVGIAPFLFLLEENNIKTVFGARTEEELICKGWLEEKDVVFCTDDGSCGREGFATKIAERVIDEGDYTEILTCGPEVMMKEVHGIAKEKSLGIQASLERWMKCGVGICGHCAMDPIGWRVCKDGPIADKETLNKLEEFGNYKRDKSGRKVNFEWS